MINILTKLFVIFMVFVLTSLSGCDNKNAIKKIKTDKKLTPVLQGELRTEDNVEEAESVSEAAESSSESSADSSGGGAGGGGGD